MLTPCAKLYWFSYRPEIMSRQRDKQLQVGKLLK